MLSFFREGLYYFYLALFMPVTLQEITRKLPLNKALMTCSAGYFIACMMIIFLLGLIGWICSLLQYDFYLLIDFRWVFIGFFMLFVLSLGLFFGVSIGFGLGVGLIFVVIIGGGEFYELGNGLGGGVIVGLITGVSTGLSSLLIRRSMSEFFIGLAGGISVGLIAGINREMSDIVNYSISFLFIYVVAYFRPFYIFPHLFQYWRSRSSRNPFYIFHNSPLYWDEVIHMPLPYLEDWLVILLKSDQQRGINELFSVIKKCPSQRKVAFKVLLADLGKFLQRIQSIDGLVGARNTSVVPAYYGSPEGLQDARRHGQTIAALAQDYKTRQTKTGQLKILDELRKEISTFHAVMKLTVAPVGTTFEPLAAKWLKMIENEQEKLYQQSTHNELPNPYIAGNPLEVRDQQLFVGRSDILLAIEQFILNADQRPSLLLYGRRRTGKSSTLLNLPRSRFEPVYIDCQDAKWHESDQAFCYNLAHDLFNVLYQSDSVRGLRQPQIEQFDKNAFTQLDQFLTQAQKIAEQRGKRILLAFDEYEELENSIINGDISEKVLGKLRNLIQHSKSIVVLVSGSHRFEELTRLNWANYLINTRTLELSYLDAESARELLTKPVPELHYEAGVVDDIIRITHCQPYLLQAVASELVNYLNSKQQTTATPDDLNTALEKTLVSASAYFSDTWRKDNSAAEQQVMRALATGKTETVLADAAFQPAIQSLIRKEIVEGTEGSYRLAVELFARWIVKNQV